MSSNQLDPRSMAEAQSVSNFTAAASPSGSPGWEYQYTRERSMWAGWVKFAGLLLVLLGFFHAVQGLVALFRHEVYVVGSRGLLVDVGFTTWGWVHLVWGVFAILVGTSLLAGRMWARIIATVVAMTSAVVSLGFLPAYPVWSAIMIAMDVIIIWAISVHGEEVKRAEG